MKAQLFKTPLKALLVMVCIFSSFSLFAEDSDNDTDWEAILNRDIDNIQKQQQVLLARMPPRRLWRRLYCYFHCVKAIGKSCCRVQMAGLRSKRIPSGTYYAPCPKKCNYPSRGNPIDDRHKPISGCTHYDKNGYWYVTFVCNAHKAHWHYDLVARYRALERQYHSFELDWRQYDGLQKELKKKRKQLDQLDD